MTARFTDHDAGVPIEQFIQALTSQLDRAQTALALKARAGLPFAVKDLTLDLRAHVEVSGSVVRIRPAGPGERESSMLRVALTTITRPMIEENTPKLELSSDEPALKEAVGNQLSDDELRRLEWAGVRTVSQLADLQQHAGSDELERVAQVPAMRLRAALQRASHPFVTDVSTMDPPAAAPPAFEFPNMQTLPSLGPTTPPTAGAVPPPTPKPASPLLVVRGHNLVRAGLPQVRIGGEAVPVLQATKRELVLAPLAHQLGGVLEIETEPGMMLTHDMAPAAASSPRSERRGEE